MDKKFQRFDRSDFIGKEERLNSIENRLSYIEGVLKEKRHWEDKIYNMQNNKKETL